MRLHVPLDFLLLVKDTMAPRASLPKTLVRSLLTTDMILDNVIMKCSIGGEHLGASEPSANVDCVPCQNVGLTVMYACLTLHRDYISTHSLRSAVGITAWVLSTLKMLRVLLLLRLMMIV